MMRRKLWQLTAKFWSFLFPSVFLWYSPWCFTRLCQWLVEIVKPWSQISKVPTPFATAKVQDEEDKTANVVKKRDRTPKQQDLTLKLLSKMLEWILSVSTHVNTSGSLLEVQKLQVVADLLCRWWCAAGFLLESSKILLTSCNPPRVWNLGPQKTTKNRPLYFMGWNLIEIWHFWRV